VTRVPVEHSERSAALVPLRDVTLTIRRDQRLRRRVSAPAELEGPLPAGRRVGSVTIMREGKRVRTVPLVTRRPVPGPGALRTALDSVGLPFILLLLAVMSLGAVLTARRLRGRLRLVRER
jgi:D-alanyl-D-alanine carboxypeptidase (penicillin-binding protein 5/6)